MEECERQQRGWRLPGTSRVLGLQPGVTGAMVAEAEEAAEVSFFLPLSKASLALGRGTCPGSRKNLGWGSQEAVTIPRKCRGDEDGPAYG